MQNLPTMMSKITLFLTKKYKKPALSRLRAARESAVALRPVRSRLRPDVPPRPNRLCRCLRRCHSRSGLRPSPRAASCRFADGKEPLLRGMALSIRYAAAPGTEARFIPPLHFCTGGIFPGAAAASGRDCGHNLRASLASMHSVAWGTFIRRSFGMSLPVVLQMP